MTRALVLAICLLGLGLGPARAAEARQDVLPEVATTLLDGASASTGQWRGQPMVINVWATWCPPCRSEMPALQRLSDRLAGSGIRVVGLSVDDDLNLVREFVLKYGIRFPIAIAQQPSAAMSALRATALPLTLYVDAEGRIIERVLGQREWGEDALVLEIRSKLGR